jgi:hypothetical protein
MSFLQANASDNSRYREKGELHRCNFRLSHGLKCMQNHLYARDLHSTLPKR